MHKREELSKVLVNLITSVSDDDKLCHKSRKHMSGNEGSIFLSVHAASVSKTT